MIFQRKHLAPFLALLSLLGACTDSGTAGNNSQPDSTAQTNVAGSGSDTVAVAPTENPEQPSTEQPSTEQPSTEQPSTEQPSNSGSNSGDNTGAWTSNSGGLNIMAKQPVPTNKLPPLQPVFPFAGIPANAPPLPASTSVPEGLDSTTNSAPYFEGLEDQIVYAGQYMELRLVPRDQDGSIPGLFTGALPEGSEYIDNFDGTKTIRWRALEPDVGTFEITVTAVDAEVPLYRTSRTIRVRVRLPDDLTSIINLPPSINAVKPHRAKAGDQIIVLVKAEDPNGTIPQLTILEPRANMTFEQFPEDDNIKVLRWQTATSDIGPHILRFRATDAKDAQLTAERDIHIELAAESDFARSGTRLRELASARNFHIGYASLQGFNFRPDGQIYSDIASSEFNILTPENSLKWGSINPKPNEWKWQAFDTEMQLAWKNSMVMHGHTLLWHRQLPQWIQTLPVEKREKVMLDFIEHVVGRYGDSVGVWDVVNEAFEEDGRYRNSVWYEAMGSGFIEKAFRQARVHAPNSQLLYNDYDVAWESPKTDAMYAMVRQLMENGVPIDGVGFQMHLKSDFNRYDSVRRNFQRFADLGLDIYITELDVALNGNDTQQRQAEVYSKVLALCLDQSACRSLQTWGFTDRYSWRKDSKPLIFDQNYNAKPAYYAIQQGLLR